MGIVKPGVFWECNRRPDRQEPWTRNISDVSEITSDVLRHVCGYGQSWQTQSKQTAIERYRLFDITERAGTRVIGTSRTVFVDVDQRTRHDADWPIRRHRHAHSRRTPMKASTASTR